jgi:hypothetical protein
VSSPEPTLVESHTCRRTPLRYIAEAPSGFVALGAKEGGDWALSVRLPRAISSRGGGPGHGPFIECVLFTPKLRVLRETTASVDVAVVQLDDDHNVNLIVQTWSPAG